MSTLLLIHGGWSAGWVWDPLIPELELRGILSRVIDLPAHGRNKRSMWSVSLMDYADAVIAEAASIEGPVIAVGHSMGGLVISQAAGRAPQEFQALAYVTAFLPRNGERLIRLAGKDKQSKISPAIRLNFLKGSIRIDESCLDDALFHDCSVEDTVNAKRLMQENPLRPGLARVHLDEQFDKIPKHYIRCLADRGITPAHQEWMASRYEIKSMQDLDTGHMPAYAAPDKLADALAEIVTVECA
jgi:pimeloyl-ACP methyl ester carboxylesterase